MPKLLPGDVKVLLF